MSRLQKKCLVVSSAFHATLILVLLFGSALMPNPEESTAKTFKVYSSAAVSDAVSSGGQPDAAVAPAPPAPAPAPAPVAKPELAAVPPPAPAPAPVAVPKPRVELPVPKPVVEFLRPKPRNVEPPKIEEPATHWYEFGMSKTKPKEQKLVKEDTKPATRHTVVIDKNELKMHKSAANDSDARDARDQRDHEHKRVVGKEIAQSLTRLSKNLSTGSQVEMPGVGGGGEATVNYRDVIMNKYLNAWSPPADLSDNVPIVSATVTIARDGSVISAHIITPAGNRSLDRSIENALETVTFIEPFPPSWKEQQRTVTVRFNLQLKRQNG